MDLLSRIQGQRIARADKQGSPYFDDYPASIAAGYTMTYDPGEYAPLADARKYLPLDYIQVVNTDSVPLELHIKNQRQYIPAGGIFSISDECIWWYALKNMDPAVATTAGKIHVVLQRQPMTEDKLVRRNLQ